MPTRRLTGAWWCLCAQRFLGLAVSTLEVALLWALCLVAGALGGAVAEIWRLHRICMTAWMAQHAAQHEAKRLREALARAERTIGAMQTTRGEVLEAAIGAAKLAQLDALHADGEGGRR